MITEGSYKKGGAIEDKKSKKGSIKDQYKDRTPHQVWKSWTIDQRKHFLNDHSDRIEKLYANDNAHTKLNIDEWATTIYSELPDVVQAILSGHIHNGEYKEGGAVDIEQEVIVPEVAPEVVPEPIPAYSPEEEAVRSALTEDGISCSDLRKLIKREPCYPVCEIGSLKLRKGYMANYKPC
jgi:hypothetical protein